MYKIKQIPEDFVVVEVSNPEIRRSGRFSYFKLRKKERNTLEVIQLLSRLLRLSEKQIGFAGSKDKQAVTEQAISIEKISKEKVQSLDLKNFSLEFLGYGDKPISLGDLEGNNFEIVIRNLDEKDKISKIKYVENYFDEQRFSENNVEIGRYIIKKDFSKIARLINQREYTDYLEKNMTNFVGALRTLPARLLKMYVHAYQSYLWNKVLAESISGCEEKKEVSYSLGKLVFCRCRVKNFKILLLGFSGIKIADPQIQKIYQKILREEGITPQDFIIRPIPELSPEGEEREAFIEVKKLKIGKKLKDELNLGKKKVKVSFYLPKGSYATMVVRKMVN